MKLSQIVISSLLAVALAKNVAVLPQFDESVFKALNLEVELAKREAKNVFTLLDKRDAKNVVNIVAIGDDDFDFRKRDAKNVADINLEISDALLVKKDGKNVINFDLTTSFDEKKRDAKNIVNLNLSFDDKLFKRDGCHMNVKLSDMKLSDDEIDHLDNLNIILDGETFEVSSKTQLDDNIEIELKPWSDKVASFIWDLSPLSDFIDSFQAKAKTYLDSNTLSGESTVTEPLKGDLASALTINEQFRIFSSYLRQLSDLYTKCELDQSEDFKIQSGENAKQLLIFAPTNEALYALIEKPWQFPTRLDSVENESKKDDIINSNIRHFVESHIVETDDIVFDASNNNKMVELRTVNGQVVYLKNDGAKGFWIHSENDDDEWILVQSVQVVENGALLSIPSSLSHP